nr:ribonuclease H-like domain-containing protein [Tanacetum cinerariifolium]
MLSSTGVNLLTSASGSQPPGNTKKDMIQQTQCRARKNKLEDYLRNVRTSLHNKKNVVNTKDIVFVPNSKLNVHSNLKCATCNGCLFSDNHDSCVLEFINSVNARVKSKSAKKPLNSLKDYVLAMASTFITSELWSGSANRFSGNNLYTLSLQDMMAYSLICLLSKASKTKSWLWHRRLSHLNFGAINHLARQGLVRGLPKLKFEKDHLCSACAMGKSTKKSHKPKSEDTNQEKLYLLHMDLCGLMRVESVNGKKHILVIVDDYSRFTWVKFLRKKKSHKPKSEDTNQEKLHLLHMDLCGPMRVESVNGNKYILVIVDDYSRFTWVKCLRLKDEAPDIIITFLNIIQVRLKVPVRCIRTDNGTEFVNQTQREYYEHVGISHETSVARSSQQNGVVERKAVAIACYTQNRSIVQIRHGKLQPKADIGFFICYAPTRRHFGFTTDVPDELLKLFMKRNFCLRSYITSKESTLQLVYDVMRLTPFYKAFLVTANVPEIYIQEFWATTMVHHHSIRFKIDNKKRIVNLEYFREMMHICLRLHGTDEGTGIIPGVPDVPTKESDEEISWNQDDDNHDDDNQDDDNQDDDDQDEGDDDDQDEGNDDDQDSDEEGKEFIHLKLSIHDEKETKDEESFDPIAKTPEHSDDEGNDDENLSLNVGSEEGQDEEDDEEELYRDVNINLEGRDIQMADSSYVSSQFVTSMLNPTPDAGIDSLFETTSQMDVQAPTTVASLTLSTPTLTPTTIATISTVPQAPPLPTTASSTILQDLLNFGSLFGFDHRLKTLEANFSEFVQTNQFTEASDRLRDEAQAENEEFLKNLDENIQKIIKGQVKEQVNAQVFKILPKIKKTVNEQLEAEVLTRSSNSSKTSYVVAADLLEMELKKILIEKMEGNKSIHRSDEQRNLYKALVEAYESDKIILDTYGDIVTLKRRRDDDADKDEEPFAGSDRGSKRRREGKEPESTSAPREKASRTTGRSTQGAADDQPIAEASQHPEWFQQQKKPPTPDRDWNKTLSATHGSIQPWIRELEKQADS